MKSIHSFAYVFATAMSLLGHSRPASAEMICVPGTTGVPSIPSACINPIVVSRYANGCETSMAILCQELASLPEPVPSSQHTISRMKLPTFRQFCTHGGMSLAIGENSKCIASYPDDSPPAGHGGYSLFDEGNCLEGETYMFCDGPWVELKRIETQNRLTYLPSFVRVKPAQEEMSEEEKRNLEEMVKQRIQAEQWLSQ